MMEHARGLEDGSPRPESVVRLDTSELQEELEKPNTQRSRRETQEGTLEEGNPGSHGSPVSLARGIVVA